MHCHSNTLGMCWQEHQISDFFLRCTQFSENSGFWEFTVVAFIFSSITVVFNDGRSDGCKLATGLLPLKLWFHKAICAASLM